MTFCLGIAVEDGLVGIADTRLLAGHEALIAKKSSSYQGPGFSFFVMTSGLRSLRDKTLLLFEEAFAKQTQVRDRLFKVVNLFAATVRRVQEEDGAALRASDMRFNIHTLIGGQMSGDSAHRLYLIYAEGNWVEIGPDTPFQIIGNSGFGKPILDRSLSYSDSMPYAFEVGILAFDATQRCAADVDYPVDLMLYIKGSYHIIEHRYDRDDLRHISQWWQKRMRNAVDELPSDWIEAAFSKLYAEEAKGPPSG